MLFCVSQSFSLLAEALVLCNWDFQNRVISKIPMCLMHSQGNTVAIARLTAKTTYGPN